MVDRNTDLCPVMLFSGKGGVGKTTLAAATAVRLAMSGAHVLVMSTDPAHSLSDAFAVPLSSRPQIVLPGLEAVELDARGMFSAAIDESVSSKAGSSMRDLLRLASQTPGVDEFGAIEVLIETMERAQHDVVILDTAPTGHTLRLLMLPDLLDSWLGKLVELKAKLARAGRVLRRLFPAGAAPANEEAFERNLEGGRRRISGLREVLSDPERSQIILVTIPEAMSVLETQRTVASLQAHNIPVATIVINQLQPRGDGCLHCERRRKIHLAEIEHLRQVVGTIPTRVVESLPWEIRGADALSDVGEMLWGRPPQLLA